MPAGDVMMSTYRCPVCGYTGLLNAPANHEICPSCGTEFDYDDISVRHDELRRDWLAKGSPWFSRATVPPSDWNPITQLVRAGIWKLEIAIATEASEQLETVELGLGTRILSYATLAA